VRFFIAGTCVFLVTAVCPSALGANKAGLAPIKFKVPNGSGSIQGDGEREPISFKVGLSFFMVVINLPATKKLFLHLLTKQSSKNKYYLRKQSCS
jgi:hypothetical protein